MKMSTALAATVTLFTVQLYTALDGDLVGSARKLRASELASAALWPHVGRSAPEPTDTITAADTARARAVRVLTDSIRYRLRNTYTCRLASCLAGVRRLATRIDSLETASLTPPARAVAAVAVSFDWTTGAMWPQGLYVWPTDTVLVCPYVVRADGSALEGTPAALVWRVGRADSVAYTTRTGQPCEAALVRGGLTTLTGGTHPVAWSYDRVEVRPGWRAVVPQARAVIP